MFFKSQIRSTYSVVFISPVFNEQEESVVPVVVKKESKESDNVKIQSTACCTSGTCTGVYLGGASSDVNGGWCNDDAGCCSSYTCAYNPTATSKPTSNKNLTNIAPNGVYGYCVLTSTTGLEQAISTTPENGPSCLSDSQFNNTSGGDSDQGNCGAGYVCLTSSTGTNSSGSTLSLQSGSSSGACYPTSGLTGTSATTLTETSSTPCDVANVACVGVSSGSTGSCCANLFCVENNDTTPAIAGQIGTCLKIMSFKYYGSSSTFQITLVNALSVPVTVSYTTINNSIASVVINPGDKQSIANALVYQTSNSDINSILNFTASGYVSVSQSMLCDSSYEIATE